MSNTKISDNPCFSSGCEGAENKGNDLIGYGKDGEEYRSLFVELDGLCQVGMILNGANCRFGLTKLMFLGHKLSSNGISQSEENIAAITDARPQDYSSEVRSFMRMV